MAHVENNLGTAVNAGNIEEEMWENWTWKETVCCCCCFSFIFLVFSVPIAVLLISKAKKGELEYRGPRKALDIVMSIIAVVLYIVVICFIFCKQRKNLKAELLEEGIVRSSGRRPPFTQ